MASLKEGKTAYRLIMTTEEHKKIKAEAEKNRQSINQYILSKVLGDKTK